MMTETEVLALLEQNQNERGIAHWKKMGARAGGLESFGIGLTRLRKLAKKIGRSHELAQQLWGSDVYDAKTIALLIDDPKVLSREQAEEQVEGLRHGMLAHVFASCDATLAKTPFAFDLACDWMDSKDDMRRRCGFTLLYELSKKKVAAMDDAYYLGRIDHIEKEILGEDVGVRGAMAAALMGIGKRNKILNEAAVRVARTTGPIDLGAETCEPFDVLKHLTNERLLKKLAK